ncbi:MAG: NADH-quinone oxidoreductase subunit NuoF [Firmicutes bacterium]|nr:NADH-quinone oxidoreductase subunit NuoF [Bacillota bacterium]
MSQVGRLRTPEDLDRLAAEGLRTLYPTQPKVLVGAASCGRAAGSQGVLEAARAEVRRLGLPWRVSETGCIGWCSQEPLLDLWLPGHGRVSYGRVKPADARRILRAAASGKPDLQQALAWMAGDENPCTASRRRYTQERNGWFAGLPEYTELPIFARQTRIVLRNSGIIDPTSLEEYVARGGYRALLRAVTELQPEDVLREVTRSGLRGRGGAGFPTGQKWQRVREAVGTKKYVICNADEGDPGAYMDRAVLEGDPHSVLEGMALGAYAMGACEGVIYVRAEYPLAVERLRKAIEQAERAGLLGEDLFGSGFRFRVRIVRGAGAFVCGEETALLASVEGHVGEPRPRPPYPAQQGLWGQPTCINNVETWANVPVIVLRGGAWYARIGTERSKGTKVFSLVGNVRNTGLIEVPMGITLGEIVEQIGGGGRDGRAVKAVQIGGPSGGCIPAEQFHLPVDYESLVQAGSIMGSGGLVVLDTRNCMVDVARYFLEFLEEESCGKCFPCRVGTQRLREILSRICAGRGTEEDLALLNDLGWVVRETSLCGLGQTAPNPVLTTLRYFRDEYVAHIREHRCPAKVCRELITYVIEPTLCDGCHACVQVCATEAILGKKKAVHRIDNGKCIRCGACLEVCQPKAVQVI